MCLHVFRTNHCADLQSKLQNMAQQSITSASSSNSHNSHRDTVSLDNGRDDALKPKHKVFLSHSGFQKGFVEHLCVELEGCFRFPFFDKRRESLPIGENFPAYIFDAIRQCDVGVVILSEEFFTSKWPMMELVAMHDRVLDEAEKGKPMFKIIPVFLRTSLKEFDDPGTCSRWLSCWHKLALENSERVQVEKWEAAVRYLRSINGLVYDGLGEVRFEKDIADEISKVVPPEVRLDDLHIQGKSCICRLWNGLKERMINDAVFLALDNMTNRDASINEVKSYLSRRLPAGSIVMVTARSKDWLEHVRLYIDESNYMEMPKLMLEEAKCLFYKSFELELRKEVHEELIL